MSDDTPDLHAVARRALARALSTAGSEPSLRGERVVLDFASPAGARSSLPPAGLAIEGGLEVSAQVLDVRALPAGRGAGAAASMAIEVALPDAPFPVRETLAGVGRSPEAAIDDAVRGWVDGVLAPLRAALAHAAGAPGAPAPRFDLTQVHPATADAPERRVAWDVFAGPLLLRGAPRDALAELLEDRPPFVVLVEADGLPTFDPARRIAWLRLFAARQHDQDAGIEVQVDSAPWARGSTALVGLPWPPVPGFLSVRQFLVLVRRG